MSLRHDISGAGSHIDTWCYQGTPGAPCPSPFRSSFTKTRERLRRLAEARSRAPHYLMRDAINQYLDREEARESFKQEAITSWEEYRETGLGALRAKRRHPRATNSRHTRGAAGLERCRRFHRLAAVRAVEAIDRQLGLLEAHPEIVPSVSGAAGVS